MTSSGFSGYNVPRAGGERIIYPLKPRLGVF